MSNVPNVCVDIFSQMANLLSNFQANSIGSSGTFTHSEGYVSTSTDPLSNQATTVTNNFEEQMNNYSFVFFISMMLAFLAY